MKIHYSILALMFLALFSATVHADSSALAGRWRTPQGDLVEISKEGVGNLLKAAAEGLGKNFSEGKNFISELTLNGKTVKCVLEHRGLIEKDFYKITGEATGALSDDEKQLTLTWKPKRYKEKITDIGGHGGYEFIKDDAALEITLTRSDEPIITEIRFYILGRTAFHPVKELVIGAPMVAEVVWSQPIPRDHVVIQLNAKAGVLSLPAVPRDGEKKVFITPIFVPTPQSAEKVSPPDGLPNPPTPNAPTGGNP